MNRNHRTGSVANFLALAMLVFSGVGLAKGGEQKSLLEVCKAECPEAKDEHGLDHCIQDKLKGADAETFKKTDCHKAHLKHEAEHKHDKRH